MINRGGAGLPGRKRHGVRFVLLSFVLAVVVFSILLMRSPDATSEQQQVVADAAPASDTAVTLIEPSESLIERVRAEGPTATPSYDLREVKVRRNDTIYTILRSMDVPSEEILRAARLSKKVYDIKRVKVGDKLKIAASEEGLKRLEFMYSELEGVMIEKDLSAEGGFSVTGYELPSIIFPRNASGVIESSLYEAAVKADVDPTAILNLSDIFAWDVDFASEIRKGDSFSILYETIHTEGRPVKTGRILAAEMTNRGKTHSAVYFTDSNGRGDYYDTDGKSLSRTLLKSPLRYRRISSHYSKRRYHPVSKKYRPHHGVDYAAPRGTPIESSGDGRVVFAGWKGGYGKYVKIRHNDTYTTAYGHLSRISKGIRNGARVRQGQVIGKVGSTGISTGPHLHYEVHIRGSMVNPLRVKSKSRKSLKGEDLERFLRINGDFMARLAGETSFASLESASAN